jgi:hypothetical protein
MDWKIQGASVTVLAGVILGAYVIPRGPAYQPRAQATTPVLANIVREPAPVATSTAAPEPPAEAPVPVTITAISKKFIPRDFEAERFDNDVEVTLRAVNQSGRTIRAFEGGLEVQDLLGNKIIVLQVRNQRPIAPGKSLQFTDDWHVNQFLNNQVQFAVEKFEDLQFKWTAEKVLFSDGTTMEFSEK